jgi:transcriptional regulator with XRE-family HTH domain
MPKAGTVIYAVRKFRGIQQKALADRVGFKSDSSLWRVERGESNVPRETVKRVADALGLKLDLPTMEIELPPDLGEREFAIYEQEMREIQARRRGSGTARRS